MKPSKRSECACRAGGVPVAASGSTAAAHRRISSSSSSSCIRAFQLVILIALVSVSSSASSSAAASESESISVVRRNSTTEPPSPQPSQDYDKEEDEEDYPDYAAEAKPKTASGGPVDILKEMIDRGKVQDASEALLRLQTSLETGVSRLFKEAFPLIIRAGLELNISSTCTAGYMRVYTGLRETKNWAFRMVDASGKPPSGILTGTLTDLGSFDECLAIKHYDEEIEGPPLLGKYCLLDLRGAIESNLDSEHPPEGVYPDGVVWDSVMREFWKRNDLLSFRYGLCVPSGCHAQDLQLFANYFAETSGFEALVGHCQTVEDLKFAPDRIQILILSGLCLIGLLLCVGTAADFLPFMESSKLARVRLVLLYFSLYSNTRKLFVAIKPKKQSLNTGSKAQPSVSGPTCSSTSSSSSSSPSSGNQEDVNLACLNGLRFLSVCWVIIGHTYYYTDFILYHHYRNLVGIQTIDDPLWFTPIGNFTLSVDTFFYISGFLLVYTSWKKLRLSAGRINLVDWVLHRVWRIWPAYAVVIGLAVVLPLVGSGPLWPESVIHQANNCRQSWWANLLFVNNFQLANQICLLHTWYLGASMQYHLGAAILLYALYRSPRTGLLSIAGLGCLLSASTYWDAASSSISAPTIIPDQVFSDYSQGIMALYMKPYTHAGAYLAGLAGGWLLLHYAHALHISRNVCIALWLAGGSVALAVIAIPHSAFAGVMPPVAVSALYWATHRVVWALFIGWIVHACATGRGGIIGQFLGWSAFRPLGNLSYLAYLIHPLLMMLHTGVARERVNFGHYTLIQTFLSRTVTSFFLSYLLHIGVELPFAHLEKEIFPSRRKAAKSSAHISPPSSVRSTSVESIGGHDLEGDTQSGDSDSNGSGSEQTQEIEEAISSDGRKSSASVVVIDKKSNTFHLNSIFRGKLKGSYAVQ